MKKRLNNMEIFVTYKNKMFIFAERNSNVN